MFTVWNFMCVCCCAMQSKRGLSRHAVSVCLSVRASVTFVHSVETNKYIYNFFSLAGSQAILVLPHQTAWQYSNGNPPHPPNGGVECRWSRLKSRFWADIWFHRVLLTLLPARCYQYDAIGPLSRNLSQFAGSKRRCLLMAGKNDEMFMTRSFNVTPETTQETQLVLG